MPLSVFRALRARIPEMRTREFRKYDLVLSRAGDFREIHKELSRQKKLDSRVRSVDADLPPITVSAAR